MKRVYLVVAIIVIALAWPIRGQDDPGRSLRQFMRQKLDHSQKVLEGITLEDFTLVKDNARQLAALSQTASWRVMQSPQYTQYSAEFGRLAEKLVRMADDRNIDGATLAYVELTINCVNCHKYFRSVKTATLDRLSRY